ncbi:hypothetical protein WJX72_005536 [[Myrmecia] bisecta]|uniref:RRM domain-containing protein n=1 Tax=[Myrmecia] bisecta TaxID=41462 RepID=A0AAW1QQU9_9CHLO
MANNRSSSTTVFVGNLPFDATEEMLKELFGGVGPIKSFRLVSDRETGKLKGFAFCEYFDEATAQSAQRNLSNYDLNGRQLRVDFADDSTREHKREQVGPDVRRPPRPRPVGMEAAHHAAQGAAALVGAPSTDASGHSQDQITVALSKMTRTQMYEIMAQMKGVIQQNPQQARQILVQNPPLTKALFQAQIMLDMVQNPVPQGSTAAPMRGPLTAAGPPGPQYPQGPVQPQVQGPPRQPLQAQLAGALQGPPHQPQQMQPAAQMPHAHQPSQPQLQYGAQPAPHMAQLGPAQQQALLQQVMNLTPQQIDILPPQQKAQVLALQQQMRAQQQPGQQTFS